MSDSATEPALRRVLSAADCVREIAADWACTEIAEDLTRRYGLAHALDLLALAGEGVPSSVRSELGDVPWDAVLGLASDGADTPGKEALWTAVTETVPALQAALAREMGLTPPSAVTPGWEALWRAHAPSPSAIARGWLDILLRERAHLAGTGADPDLLALLRTALAGGRTEMVSLLGAVPRKRPSLWTVELAVRHGAIWADPVGSVFAPLLERLDAMLERGAPIGEGASLLLSDQAGERWLGMHYLARVGVRATDAALRLARRAPEPARTHGARLAVEIANETMRVIGGKNERLLCARCFAQGVFRLRGSTTISGYLCWACLSARHLMLHSGRVTCVLDNRSPEVTTLSEGAVRVNWLARRARDGVSDTRRFDFHEIFIRSATDEEARDFLTALTSDPNPARLRHYGRLNCTIDPECALGEDTVTRLREVLGRVWVRREARSRGPWDD